MQGYKKHAAAASLQPPPTQKKQRAAAGGGRKAREPLLRPGKEMESESTKEMKSGSRKEMESVDHQAELFTLHEEIMSLVSERNNLLASLTPNLFVWEGESWPDLNPQQQVREEESASTWRIAGQSPVQKMDSSLTEPAEVSGSRPTWQPEQLESYLDSVLPRYGGLGPPDAIYS